VPRCTQCGAQCGGRSRVTCSRVCHQAHFAARREERKRRVCAHCATAFVSETGRKTCSDACALAKCGLTPPPPKREKKKRVCVDCSGTYVYGPKPRSRCDDCFRLQLAEKKARAVGVCAVCGTATPRRRKTCSPVCHSLLQGAVDRTPRAERRRRAKQFVYREKDKAEIVASLKEKQAGRCASCGSDGLPRGLVLDHCHKLNEPRLLLCNSCNTSFGLMQECPDRIRGLLQYAEDVKAFFKDHTPLVTAKSPVAAVWDTPGLREQASALAREGRLNDPDFVALVSRLTKEAHEKMRAEEAVAK
jgi:hypothetical protein